MLQATAICEAVSFRTKPAAEKTCATCPHFNNRFYPESKGWCNLFDHQAKTHHIRTNDCVLNSTTREQEKHSDIFANHSEAELEALREEAFPTEVIELDSNGYPMGDETVDNAYSKREFETLPNEPF